MPQTKWKIFLLAPALTTLLLCVLSISSCAATSPSYLNKIIKFERIQRRGKKNPAYSINELNKYKGNDRRRLDCEINRSMKLGKLFKKRKKKPLLKSYDIYDFNRKA